jgi:hypothetical protein
LSIDENAGRILPRFEPFDWSLYPVRVSVMLWLDNIGRVQRMPDRRAKVVIVGGGFGGIEAAKSLASIKIAISGRLRSSRVKFGTGFVVE